MKALELNQINLLWHLNFYDGMLSGICLYKNQPFYFYCIETNPKIYETKEDKEFTGWYRKFLLVKLTKKEYNKETTNHYFFKKYVSHNSDYLNNKAVCLGVQKEDLWHLFYDNKDLIIDRKIYEQKKAFAYFYN